MPRDNQFLVGLLQGLYSSGLGNSEVNDRKQALQLEQDKQMSDQGMVPIHPHTDNVALHTIKNVLFPTSLNGAYQKDPNKPVSYIDASGEPGIAKPGTKLGEGQYNYPLDKTVSLQNSKEKQKPRDAMLVYDKKTGRPRIEDISYQVKPGELSEISNMGEALTKLGSFSSNEARGGFLGARETQIRAQMRDEFSKSIDPSVLPPTSVLGRAAQSIKRVVSGDTLLKEGEVTNQARLQAAKADLDVIITNASATVEGQKMLSTPTLISSLRQLQSYLSTDPGQVPVPKEVVDIYRKIISDLGPISQDTVQKYIDRTYRLKKGAYKSTLSPEEMDSYVQDVKDQYDVKKILKKIDSGDNSDLSSMSDDELRKIAGVK